MKSYRAYTIKIINPKSFGQQPIEEFNALEAAYVHKITKMSTISRALKSQQQPPLNKIPTKKQLGKGSYKTVYMIDGTPPNTFISLDKEYVLAKLRLKERGGDAGSFLSNTLVDAVNQMVVYGQKETTVFFSCRNSKDAPDWNAFRFCLYMPKLRGSEWEVKKYTIADNISILIQVFKQIKLLHLNGFFHSDIKPANTMVDGNLATIIDFGGMQRVWKRYSTYTRLYCPFAFDKRSTDVPIFWFNLATGILNMLYPMHPNVDQVPLVKKLDKCKDTFAKALANIEHGSSAKRRSNIESFGNVNTVVDSVGLLESMPGIYLDMGSIVAILVSIFIESSDKGSFSGNDHDLVLWSDCVDGFFHPKKVLALLDYYESKCNVIVPHKSSFESAINSAARIDTEWSPTIGIDLDSLSETIASKEVAAHKKYNIATTKSESGIRADISALVKADNPNIQFKTQTAVFDKEIDKMSKHMFELFKGVASADVRDEKRYVMYLIMSGFRVCKTVSQLKMLVERFFYISLLNRNSGFKSTKYTKSFSAIISVLEFAALRNVDQIRSLKRVLHYVDKINVANKDSLWEALRINQKDYGFVFNHKSHAGGYTEILNCFSSVLVVKDNNNQPITLTRENLKIGNRIEVSATDTGPMVVDIIPYDTMCDEIVNGIMVNMNLDIHDHVMNNISAAIKRQYA